MKLNLHEVSAYQLIVKHLIQIIRLLISKQNLAVTDWMCDNE